jgi:hypothetical protein
MPILNEICDWGIAYRDRRRHVFPAFPTIPDFLTNVPIGNLRPASTIGPASGKIGRCAPDRYGD